LALRVALLSDVHGNLPALQAVLHDIEPFHPDKLVVAGDFVGGPHLNEVIQTLRAAGAIMIFGNNDLFLLKYLRNKGPEEWNTLKQFGLLRWNARQISQENIRFLRSLPEQTVITLPGTDAIRVVHGSPRDPVESLFPEKEPLSLDLALKSIVELVLVCGHTHQPWFLHRNGKLAVNPGAVANPLNGEFGAQYAMLEWQNHHWEVSLKTVQYDFSLIKSAFEQSGFLQAGGPIARGFLLSIETGRDVAANFIDFAFELAKKAGYPDSKFIPDQILDQAEAEFPWTSWRD
jgi:putative phosphoesterase